MAQAARPKDESGKLDIEELSGLTLGDAAATSHRLGDFWADQPVILVFLRHFG